MLDLQQMLWIVFSIVITFILILDLGFLSKKAHKISTKTALSWSAVWIGIALGFNVLIFYLQGSEKGFEFLTGYIVEKSLSVDNLFVFVLIFAYFNVPQEYQPKILMWGIIGAILTRALFIFAGIGLITYFHWMIYVFAGLLIYASLKMLFFKEEKIEMEKNLVIRGFKKIMRITHETKDDKFFTKINGLLYATPLFIVVLAIESTDVVFATDSIPAIFAITTDAFIVYTSNIFAIIGLRMLYFALANIMNMFSHLKYGLVAILLFLAVKMFLSEIYEIPTIYSLGVVFSLLAIAIGISLVKKKNET